jgi:ubiquinone/menaquinone biosynthesis C-methylase UbiE
MSHKFDPTHMARLESPERRRFLDPDRILEAIGVRPGAIIADISCGPGFFSMPAARAVGPEGTIYAIDLAPEMLQRVEERAREEGFGNVVPVQASESGSPVKDGSCDLALAVNVLHETEDRVAFLVEARRILRDGGALAVVEWKKEPTEKGPPVDERVSSGEIAAWAKAAGFDRFSVFEAGPYSNGMLCRK